MRHPCLSPSINSSFRHLLSLLFALLFFLPLSCCDEASSQSQLYYECQERPFQCGDRIINISYPFTNESHQECGHPEFGFVTCNPDDESINVSIGDKEYQVGDVDYSEHLLTLVLNDTSFSDDVCRPQNSTSASLDPSLFSYTDVVFNASFYNCPSTLTNFPWLYAIGNSCPSNPSKAFYYWPNTSLPDSLASQCTLVQFPMNKQVVEDMITNTGKIDSEKVLQDGFTVNWTQVWESCSACSTSGGVCGNGSTASTPACYCPSGRHSEVDGTCHPGGGITLSHILKNIVIGSTTGVGLLLVSTVLFLYVLKRNKSKKTQKIEALLKEYGPLAPKRFKYSDLKKITDSFGKKLGQGGFGSVFQGKLQDDCLVAVKILNKTKENGSDFINEVASISRTSHVNIVGLLGFCLDDHRRALIYEFMPNGSLDKYIYADKPKAVLSWDKLYQIAIGIARGLEYLHRGCNTRIVHFDIKPQNILLDENFYPKISDFGLAKLCLQKESILSMADARGTIGYIAPEVFSRTFGVVSAKSDVYSYGMMLLEMVGGRKNAKACVDRSSEVYFPHWVYEHLDQDGGLQAYDVTEETEEMARKMTLVGLSCIQTIPTSRPSMSRVVEMLEGSVGDIEMPPKPELFSPVRSVVNSPIPLSSLDETCS